MVNKTHQPFSLVKPILNMYGRHRIYRQQHTNEQWSQTENTSIRNRRDHLYVCIHNTRITSPTKYTSILSEWETKNTCRISNALTREHEERLIYRYCCSAFKLFYFFLSHSDSFALVLTHQNFTRLRFVCNAILDYAYVSICTVNIIHIEFQIQEKRNKTKISSRLDVKRMNEICRSFLVCSSSKRIKSGLASLRRCVCTLVMYVRCVFVYWLLVNSLWWSCSLTVSS